MNSPLLLIVVQFLLLLLCAGVAGYYRGGSRLLTGAGFAGAVVLLALMLGCEPNTWLAVRYTALVIIGLFFTGVGAIAMADRALDRCRVEQRELNKELLERLEVLRMQFAPHHEVPSPGEADTEALERFGKRVRGMAGRCSTTDPRRSDVTRRDRRASAELLATAIALLFLTLLLVLLIPLRASLP